MTYSTTSVAAVVRFMTEEVLQVQGSGFGALMFCSSLRDHATGRYLHNATELRFGEELGDRAWRTVHERAFAYWLGCTLAEQKSSVERHLSQLPQDHSSVIADWQRSRSLDSLVPSSAGAQERSLCMSDIKVVLRMIQAELAEPALQNARPTGRIDVRVELLIEVSDAALCDRGVAERTARSFGLTQRYLGQLFRRHTGRTVSQYLRIVRIKKALTILFDWTRTVQQVALLSGYTDASNFNHDFKLVLGTTPKAFREKYRVASVPFELTLYQRTPENKT